MRNKILFLLLFVLCLSLAQAVILGCNGYHSQCEIACSNSAGVPSQNTAEAWSKVSAASWMCARSTCDPAYDECIKQMYASVKTFEMPITLDDSFSNNPDSNPKYKEVSCDQISNSGCCEGYYRTEFMVCCRDGTTAVRNEETGQVACFDDSSPTLDRVEVKGTKSTLRADGEDSMQVTFRFIAKDDGKDVPFTPGIVSLASSNVKSTNNAYTSEILGNTVYTFSPSQGKVNSNGEFKTTLKVDEAQVTDATKIKEIKLRVAYDKGYDPSNSNTYHEFGLDVPPISILSVKKQNPTKPVEQDSWGIFTITVDDSASQKKNYEISSPVGAIRINGKSKAGTNKVTSKENTLQFAWQAPHISKDLKLNVAAELATIDRKAIGSVAEAYSKDKLDFVLKQANPALAQGVEFMYQGGLKAGQQAKGFDSAKKSVEEHFPGAAQAYEEGRYQMLILESGILLIDGYNFVDGAIGFITGPAKGASEFNPGDVAAKASLNWIRDYSELVTRIDKAANSKEITQTYPIIIKVSAGGPANTRTIRVPVVGQAVLWRGKDIE